MRLLSKVLSLLVVLAVLGSASGLARQRDKHPADNSLAGDTQGADSAASREIPQEETALVQSRLSAIASPDSRALAKALGVEIVSKEKPSDSAPGFLRELGDLDADGIPEYALEWTGEHAPAPEAENPEDSTTSWALFLLAWDGTLWQGSPLRAGFEPFAVEVLPATASLEREIAVVVYAGATAVPYPAIFRFKAHQASLIWDGRSDASRFQGYDDGKVEFRSANGSLEMVATGRADPGFLVFPKNGRRGFDARAIYDWDGKAFIPAKTEYAANQDFTLYRFISALHLHDFRTAYTLIDPAKFLNADKPSLQVFRKTLEDTWPEFLDDKIFRARDSGAQDETFELRLDDKVYVYLPSFSDGSPLLLTGLERREQEPESR